MARLDTLEYALDAPVLQPAVVWMSNAKELLGSLNDLNIRLRNPVFYDDVFKLAEYHSLTFRDAAYLQVAIREDRMWPRSQLTRPAYLNRFRYWKSMPNRPLVSRTATADHCRLKSH
jgi:hypothetical protein